MAHALGKEVVAEGIEGELQRLHLARLGCDLAQGYLFSQPLEAPELVRWFSQRASDSEPRRSHTTSPASSGTTGQHAPQRRVRATAGRASVVVADIDADARERLEMAARRVVSPEINVEALSAFGH